MDRVRIFNRLGAILAEIQTSVSRSWVIGAAGAASFTVATRESYCNETILNFGNWVLVESDAGIPAWVGIISSHEWGTRELTIAVKSPEHLLSQRVGPVEEVITNSAGGIFARILETVNAAEMTILRAGNIWRGASMQETLNPTQLDTDLKRIQTRSRQKYQWRPEINAGGTLIVYGDWFERLGIDTGFVFYESNAGGNIEGTSRILVSDAPKANYILGYGKGTTWTSRLIEAVKDTASVNRYGLIQKSISYYGVKKPASLVANAQNELGTAKNPFAAYDVNALNVGDTFQYCKLGNRATLRMQNVGFTNGTLGTERKVKITGMFYNPANAGKLELVLEAYA